MFSLRKGHYEPAEWVDFVRGVADNEARGKMQAHLDAGCDECGRVAAFFSQVSQCAAASVTYDVPDYAIKNVRAIYALQRPEEVRLLPRTMARLIYDSFREPLPAGVRSQQHTAHQLMYVAGPYCVDLRLEQERGSTQVRLIGQIANQEHGAKGVSEVPVYLMSRNLVVNKTATNKFGEFAMEYAPTKGLRLFAPIPGEHHIEIPMSVASAKSEDVNS